MITLHKINTGINADDSISRFQTECVESAFEALMNKTFINALKPNVKMTADIAKECVAYSTKVLRNAGGISLVVNALESINPTEISKKEFLEGLLNACVESGLNISSTKLLTEAAIAAIEDASEDDMTDDEYESDDMSEDDEVLDEIESDSAKDLPPEMPKEFEGKELNEIQLDTKISEKELDALKKAADDVDIDHISQVVADKVTNVIQAEKVQRYKLNEEKERIKQAIIDDPNNAIEDEDAAESAMESLLSVPVSRLDTGVYTTLFSTLQRRAIESTLVYERGNTNVSDMLAEITVNNTLNVFTPQQLTFFEATSKAIEMSVATECCDDEHMENVIKNATTFATIMYTMLELLHTMNLGTCAPSDVRNIITKNADDCAPATKVEAGLKNYEKALEDKKKYIFECARRRDTAGLETTISDMKIIKGRLIEAKENARINYDADILTKIDGLIDLASTKIGDIESMYQQGSEATIGIDRVTPARESDLSQMNSIARALKYKKFDNVKFTCCESAGSSAVFSVSAEVGKQSVYKTTLNVSGMESADPAKYINYLLKQSKFNDMSAANESLDFCVINKGQVYSIG